jgi:amino-acid N-acetyltransferase
VVTRLLEDAKLPTADITPDKLQSFYALEQDGQICGVVGLELYDTVGLLRSLVVSPRRRTQGIGSALVAHAEHLATERGVAALYLLTNTAEAFFRRRGYEPVARERAPEPIRQTSEFADLCPTTSALMVKRLVHSPLP